MNCFQSSFFYVDIKLNLLLPKNKTLKIFHSLQEFNCNKKTVVTIGTFDGVHLGHQKIIDKIILNAKESSCESLILTFFPHPRMVLKGESDIKLLNTIDEKIVLLQKMGLQNLIIQTFDTEFSELSAEEFIEKMLLNRLNIQKIIIGHDHRFGKNRSANIDDLILFGAKYGFEVEEIPAETINEVSVSSTKIRNAILAGNIPLANEYLGYEYFLTGTVLQGRQLGRTIGFPTANIHIDENYKLIPKTGVYIVKSILNGKTVFGMMNIGTRPTVGGESLSIEVHYLNFQEDLYAQKITVSLLQYVRGEQKFGSVALLQEQLEKDKLYAKEYIRKL